MEYELEVIGLDAGIVSLQLLQHFNYFVNSYNCHDCAYNVKYSPDNYVPFVDWLKNMVIPFL